MNTLTPAQRAAVLFTATQAHEADKKRGIDLPNGTTETARNAAMIVREAIETMTQDAKLEPKDGEDWWILPNFVGGIIVGRIIDGVCLTSLGDLREKDVKPIARVLTPEEVAAKDAEIERLRQTIAGLTNASQNIVDASFDHYRAKNGRIISIEGDDGEKCMIVPFDPYQNLCAALTHATEAGK